MQGVFITMEGVEGSGKSTQLLRLSERLRHLDLPVVVSKEPGGTALGRELRRLLLERHARGETWCPEAELLLFYADRAQHLETVIRPSLAAGKIVLAGPVRGLHPRLPGRQRASPRPRLTASMNWCCGASGPS